jgi:hypothetical protein
VLVSSATASASTKPVTIENRYFEGTAVSSATYNGSGGNRGVPNMFYGQFSGTHGNQRSLCTFAIPAEVRNCVAIDRIDLAVWNDHHFNGGGNAVHFVVHHGAFQGGFPAQFPGSTGVLQLGGANWAPHAPRANWMNSGSMDGGWMTNCQGLVAPGRTSMAEEFRVNGAHGIGLVGPSTAQGHYGYANGAAQSPRPQIRMWYRVRVG